MNITNGLAFADDPVLGSPPQLFFGTDNAPDGAAEPYLSAPLGSVYVQRDVDTAATLTGSLQKVKDDGAANDWTGLQCISKTVALADFTDGGAAVGTYVLAQAIPVGALFLYSQVIGVTGFAGDTSAVLTIGDGTDVDRYNTGTPSVFATANQVAMGAASGTVIHTAAATVTLTVTTAADWGSVSAGALTVRLWFLR
jgi:hypothetical protein